MTYPQSEKSYGGKHDCIALFDFVTATDQQLDDNWEHALDLVGRVLVQLSWEQLRPKIISNDICRGKPVDGKYYGCIPFLEVWYPEDIPLSMITQIYRVDGSSRNFTLEPVSMSEPIEPRAPESPSAESTDWFKKVAESSPREH